MIRVADTGWKRIEKERRSHIFGRKLQLPSTPEVGRPEISSLISCILNLYRHFNYGQLRLQVQYVAYRRLRSGTDPQGIGG